MQRCVNPADVREFQQWELGLSKTANFMAKLKPVALSETSSNWGYQFNATEDQKKELERFGFHALEEFKVWKKKLGGAEVMENKSLHHGVGKMLCALVAVDCPKALQAWGKEPLNNMGFVPVTELIKGMKKSIKPVNALSSNSRIKAFVTPSLIGLLFNRGDCWNALNPAKANTNPLLAKTLVSSNSMRFRLDNLNTFIRWPSPFHTWRDALDAHISRLDPQGVSDFKGAIRKSLLSELRNRFDSSIEKAMQEVDGLGVFENSSMAVAEAACQSGQVSVVQQWLHRASPDEPMEDRLLLNASRLASSRLFAEDHDVCLSMMLDRDRLLGLENHVAVALSNAYRKDTLANLVHGGYSRTLLSLMDQNAVDVHEACSPDGQSVLELSQRVNPEMASMLQAKLNLMKAQELIANLDSLRLCP